MDAPVHIVVESRDAKAAELVGRAVGQALKDTYGFSNVAVANIVADAPGFRAWSATQGVSEKPETLMDAMREANPNLFAVPVTVISRENPNSAEVNLDGPWSRDDGLLSAPLVIGAIGEEGITAEEAVVLAADQEAQHVLKHA